MKQLLTVFLVLSLFALTANAQQPVKFGAGAHAGFAISAFPSGVSEFYGMGFGGGGHLDVGIIDAFKVRVNMEYYSFPSDKEKLKPFVASFVGIQASDIASLSGGSFNIFSVNIDAIGKVPTPSGISPYALFGFGIYGVGLSDLSGTSTDGRSKTITSDQIGAKTGAKFGLNFGAGTEIHVAPKIDMFLEFKYILVFTEDESSGAVPIMLGATFAL